MKQALAVVLVILVAAAAHAQAPEFLSGETLDFTLAWSRISGGTARMTIAPLDPTRLRITSVGKSSTFFSRIFKVRDEIETIVDRSTFSTLQYHKILDEKGKRKDELTLIDEKNGVALRKGKSVEVPIPVFDPLSLIYHLRTLDLAPGNTHEFTVVADGKVYTLRATVLSREVITTPAGTFKAVVVEPKMESQAGVFKDEQNRLLVWYSDDERRLPLRIRSEVRVGSITATLRSVTAGVTSTEP